MTEQGDLIKQALARAISGSPDTVIRASTADYGNSDSQFPPSHPFARSTW